jgi:uncharacterized protein (TIGR02246 family)
MISNAKSETMTSSNVRSAAIEDDSAVRAVLEGVYAAWADNDADAFVADYAEDATAVLPGRYLPNKDAIRAMTTAVFAGSLKGSRAIYEVQRTRFLGLDTAIVISTGAVLLATQTEPSAENRALETWVLTDGTRHIRFPPAVAVSPQATPSNRLVAPLGCSPKGWTDHEREQTT